MNEELVPDLTIDEEEVNYGDQYPGFIVVCKQCGSADVQVENWLGYSEESGSWGNVELRCDSCNNECVLGGFS